MNGICYYLAYLLKKIKRKNGALFDNVPFFMIDSCRYPLFQAIDGCFVVWFSF